jgi:thiol-disulfide isomerase/thioredoxin
LKRLTLVYVFFISIILFSCKSNKKSDIIFEISGNLESFESQEILLQSNDIDGVKTLFIAEKQNGKFSIKSKTNLPINQYYLKVGNSPKYIPVLIDNTDITVYLDNLDLDNSYTKGTSEYQVIYSKYKSASKRTEDLFVYQKKFIETNKNTELGAIALKELLGKTKWRLEQSKIIFDQLAPFIQKSDLGKEIDTYITTGLESIIKEPIKNKPVTGEVSIAKSKTIDIISTSDEYSYSKITSYAPYFYANTLNREELSAKAIFNRNKLTLIDFWASWCAPCRAQNPDLIVLYNKYHNDGFEILSIAEDKNLNNWQAAVTEDQMNWQHVIDDYKRIANMYQVKSIPYALLVNKQGGIISKKVSIGKLKSLLQKEFGY